MVTDARGNRARIKILGSSAVMCETTGYGKPASFLFRTGMGSIAAYCEVNARQHAAQFRIRLPESTMKLMRAG